MKKGVKVYLTEEDIKSLSRIAGLNGFTGRGALSHLLEKISKVDILLLDGNLKKFSSLLNVSLDNNKVKKTN